MLESYLIALSLHVEHANLRVFQRHFSASLSVVSILVEFSVISCPIAIFRFESSFVSFLLLVSFVFSASIWRIRVVRIVRRLRLFSIWHVFVWASSSDVQHFIFVDFLWFRRIQFTLFVLKRIWIIGCKIDGVNTDLSFFFVLFLSFSVATLVLFFYIVVDLFVPFKNARYCLLNVAGKIIFYCIKKTSMLHGNTQNEQTYCLNE